MSWMIEHDVQRGRSHMNLTHWGEYNSDEQQGRLAKLSILVKRKSMPLPRYLFIHPGARPTDAELAHLYQWARRESKRLSAASAVERTTTSGGAQ